jgi:tetratricopeptide (TPR) repeat protein
LSRRLSGVSELSIGTDRFLFRFFLISNKEANLNKKPDFDIQAAHRYFSASCFNAAWEYIDKTDRTPEENDRMIRLAQVSMWHWLERDDRKDQNLSVGYWQLSRVYVLTGRIDDARSYGELSLQYAQSEEPFYKGYALEALARAESAAGNREETVKYLSEARELSDQVSDPDWRKLLVDDLNNIKLP